MNLKLNFSGTVDSWGRPRKLRARTLALDLGVLETSCLVTFLHITVEGLEGPLDGKRGFSGRKTTSAPELRREEGMKALLADIKLEKNQIETRDETDELIYRGNGLHRTI